MIIGLFPIIIIMIIDTITTTIIISATTTTTTIMIIIITINTIITMITIRESVLLRWSAPRQLARQLHHSLPTYLRPKVILMIVIVIISVIDQKAS